MKTVFLTGATGYIGQFAVQHLLRKKYTVHAVTSKSIDNRANDKTGEDVVWHQANLLDPFEVKDLMKTIQPTHLLHFAWYVEHGKFWSAVENLDWLAASLHLARQFVENGGKRMVISGTCAEYDWTSASPFFEKTTPFRPQTLYGAAKSSLALTLEKYAQVSDCSFASGKIFFPFGANESPNRLVPSVIRSLLEDKPAETSHGNQIRDFLYVEDVAEAFVALLDSTVEDAVNIASGEARTIREAVLTIANLLGKEKNIIFGAVPSPKDEAESIVADTEKLNAEVGWKPLYTFAQRIQETIKYWENHRSRTGI